MANPLAFILASMAILFAPGPTNTLLMISGAVAGARRSLSLVAAAVSGYLSSILLLVAGIGPLVHAVPALAVALKVVASLYLLGVAISLWKRSGLVAEAAKPVAFHQVFVTTLLNPKALVLTFFVVPHLFDDRLVEALPYLFALAAMALAGGTMWMLGGALIGIPVSQTRTGGLAQRFGAVAQFSFAAVLLSSVFWG